MTDLSAALRAAAQQHGVRPFLLGEGNPVTFGGLDALADRCAAGLAARGIAAGDRVAVAGLNTVDWLTLFFGATRLGAAVVYCSAGETAGAPGQLSARALVEDFGLPELPPAAVLCGVAGNPASDSVMISPRVAASRRVPAGAQLPGHWRGPAACR